MNAVSMKLATATHHGLLNESITLDRMKSSSFFSRLKQSEYRRFNCSCDQFWRATSAAPYRQQLWKWRIAIGSACPIKVYFFELSSACFSKREKAVFYRRRICSSSPSWEFFSLSEPWLESCWWRRRRAAEADSPVVKQVYLKVVQVLPVQWEVSWMNRLACFSFCSPLRSLSNTTSSSSSKIYSLYSRGS